MSEDVTNLRGGLPKWFVWIFGVVLTVGMWAAPFVADLIKASNNPSQIQDLARDMASVKQEIAVMKAVQAGANAIQELHNKSADAKLDAILLKRK